MWMYSSIVGAELVVLQYHHVANNTPASTSVSAEQFAKHLAYLDNNQFTVVHLDEAIEKLQSGQALPDKAVAITFDDGYANLAQHAVPLLTQYQFPYTIFVNPGLIDPAPQSYLSWQVLAALPTELARVANHGWRHDYWLRRDKSLSQVQHQQQVFQLIDKAQQTLERQLPKSLLTRQKMLAYPFGEFDTWLQQGLQSRGYIAFGQQSGAIGQGADWTALPRFPASGVYADLSTLKVKLHSLAMPIADVTPHSSRVKVNQNPPLMTVRLKSNDDFDLAQLNCFVSGQGRGVVEKVDQLTFTVSALQALAIGRSRFNCTLPSVSKPGRFYWFSKYWLAAAN